MALIERTSKRETHIFTICTYRNGNLMAGMQGEGGWYLHDRKNLRFSMGTLIDSLLLCCMFFASFFLDVVNQQFLPVTFGHHAGRMPCLLALLQDTDFIFGAQVIAAGFQFFDIFNGVVSHKYIVFTRHLKRLQLQPLLLFKHQCHSHEVQRDVSLERQEDEKYVCGRGVMSLHSGNRHGCLPIGKQLVIPNHSAAVHA